MIQLLGPIANIATTWLQGKQEKARRFMGRKGNGRF